MIIHDEIGILPDLSSAKKVMTYLGKINPSLKCYLSQRKTESAVSQFPARQGSLDGGSSTKTPLEVISQRVNPLTNADETYYDLEDLSISAPNRRLACKELLALYKDRFDSIRETLNFPISHVYHLTHCGVKGIRFAGFMLSNGDIILNANAKKEDDLKVVWIIYYTTCSWKYISLERLIFGLNNSTIVTDVVCYDRRNRSLKTIDELVESQNWRQI